jgi:hypothetical protein
MVELALSGTDYCYCERKSVPDLQLKWQDEAAYRSSSIRKLIAKPSLDKQTGNGQLQSRHHNYNTSEPVAQSLLLND